MKIDLKPRSAAIRIRSQAHTPGQILESQVGMKGVEGGIDVHKGAKRLSFLIVALKPLQRLLRVSKPRVRLRRSELFNLRVVF